MTPPPVRQADVIRIGLEVGGLLNLVADDDLRDDLHGLFERTLNDALFTGSVTRGAVVAMPLAEVIPIHSYSRKVQ